MAKQDVKIEWLRAVYDAKETLFGAFSDKLTKLDKLNAWRQMHEKAQALALVPSTKDYVYTRDTFWQNIRKAAMKKRDNSRATGSGTTKFNEVDDMVYQIIGKESPTLIGLPVPESGEVEPIPSTVVDKSGSTESSSGSTDSTSLPIRIVSKNPIKAKVSKKKYDDLKLKKMNLIIKLLEKENYLKDLKIKKLERDLNVSSAAAEETKGETSSHSNSDEDLYAAEYLEDSE